VLVADDEPHIGRVLQVRLEANHFVVKVARDGEEALAILRSDQPLDLVLLDLMMPGRSGLDVLAELRRLPARKGLPVIVLTAKGEERDRARALALGATDFITKPFSPKKLAARIDELVP
jgi:DNA-binding response OmpR family regulator